MDTELGLIIKSRGLQLGTEQEPLQIHADQQGLLTRLVFVLLFRGLCTVLFKVVLFLCWNVDVPSLECTTGITLVFSWLKKGKI